MDRLFDDFGFGRGWSGPRHARGWFAPAARESRAWTPDIELSDHHGELVVRVDLPGLTKDDVSVNVTGDRLTIQGERKQEHEDEREGVYRSERRYGSFRREILLPPGAMTDQAKAAFHDGVLEVTMPAPPESTRYGRRLEISDGAAKPKPVVQK